MNEPEVQLKKLGLSESEITVYLRMAAGAVSARDLMKTTKMKRPTIYYALNSLEKRGLVSKNGKETDATFSLAPFERLMALAKEKENEAMYLTEQISELVPALSNLGKSKMEKPTVSFYEGVDAVKHVIMDVMYSKSRKVDVIAPAKNFFWGVGREFLTKYVEERRRRKIVARNLWEVEIGTMEFSEYYSDFSEVRMMPDVMKNKFTTTIMLFDDKTLYISSYENAYAIMVNSQEHKDTVSALYEGLWAIAKKHSVIKK